MTPKQREAWNQRPLTVKVTNRCDSCGTLKDDVQLREFTGYYPAKYSVKITSCAGCFEVEKRKSQDEAKYVGISC